jgi:hypothetical protein
MSRYTRRFGALATVAFSTTALILPIASVTAAVATTPVLVFVRDGALVSAAPGALSSTTAIAPLSPGRINSLSSSGDGARFAYQQVDISNAGRTVRTRIAVHDAGGQLVRTLDDQTMTFSANFETSTGTFASLPALSQDGSRAVWDFSTPTTQNLRTAPVAAGAAATIPGSNGLDSARFLDAATVLAETSTGALMTLPVVGGTPVAVHNSPTNLLSYEVAPDGSSLVYSDPLGSGTRLQAAPLTKGTDGSYTVGAPVLLSSDFNSFAARVSADGATVYWSQDTTPASSTATPNPAPNADLFSVAITGGTPTNLTDTASIESEVVALARDTVAPTAATTNPFSLNGTSAKLSWGLPSDSDLSGVRITRTLGTTVQKSVYVPAPMTSYADTGLALGSTYSYSISTLDRSGNTGTPVIRSLTALSASTAFASPTSTTSTKAAFPVVFGKGDPSGTAFTVDYRVNGGAFTSWVANKAGQSRVFGAPSSGAAATKSIPGSTYAFRVTASDAYGNSTTPTVSGPAVVPYDQTKAAFSKGSGTAGYRDRYLGSVTVLKTAGATAKLTLVGYRFQVIGERCRTCGAFDVYSGSTRIGSIDTYAKTRQARAVLYTGTW